MNKNQNIYCFLFPDTLYSKMLEVQTALKGIMMNKRFFKFLKHFLNVPTLIAALLTLYGFAVLTQNTAGGYLI